MVVIFNENELKGILEKIYEKQLEEPTICPRCGKGIASINTALSRRAKVMICSPCGTDEALIDMSGLPPLAFGKWNYFKDYNKEEN